ncbi:hypothetical protein N7450_007757 [Penicillium hetheringtonii]|uniref:Enoyl reductase (ER) domain-containing protein n=1 Tax=Penicillium hetheringtonii TaxID=911720 RepID=A0AAD6DES2_9EURO|nr:hypothetical protein N7450_007757 [Penicillium hetheringtonii]
MINGKYPSHALEQGIPASDCAAEVIAMGENVSGFEIGDRVAPIFDLNALEGTETIKRTLGGDADGVLREFAIFDQAVLVHLPEHLSWEEAACVTVAGTTAWNCLNMPNDEGIVLLQGTGGVSMFALLLCLTAGIHIIITSSSDEKLEKIKALGPPGTIETINYKKHHKWEDEVKRLTNDRGVDIVIETGGPTTLGQSLDCLARRGTISLIGILGGLQMDRHPDVYTPLFQKTATIKAIFVGLKVDQENLCDYLSEHKISLKPLLDDRIFSFEDSQGAFDYLYSGQHTGKVVIKL